MHRNILSLVASLVMIVCCKLSAADQHLFQGDIEQYKLGKKVFSDYCSRCHGEDADGRGKAIPMYLQLKAPRPSNFKVKFFSIRPKQYLTNIIRDGGEKHSLSQYMPPFGSELDTQQIDNVVYFIQNVSLYSSLHPSKKKQSDVRADNE